MKMPSRFSFFRRASSLQIYLTRFYLNNNSFFVCTKPPV
jgi:hypothetical protein